MPVPFQGGCRCGAVRYEVTAEPIAVVDCHCRDCQYSSGTGFATIVLVPRPAFRQLSGTTQGHTVTADSGNKVTRHFCPTCGTPLFGENETKPGVLAIKAASLDDPSALKVMAAIFTKSAQPWSHLDPALPAFVGMPPAPPPKG
ncbi:GFA family protein [Rhizomicrobium electricum]|uniref:GFA family protein n=1 Tax=Rhizomicrobium electricum TaxID=480070 RepID=A0ABP3Q7T5_9PROT|nr:GFA family protein [Rhizomicrobium electricum]NIJ49279.1 hypothetical protein [Rhizomicrobium electricum]